MVKKKIVQKSKHNEVVKAESKDLNFFYADGTQALKKVNLPVYENKIAPVLVLKIERLKILQLYFINGFIGLIIS